MNKPLFMIIDGSSLLHRAFYAIPPLSNSAGIPTNAVYGFLNMLERLKREYKPDYLAVALDKSRKTFRNQTYEAYKANRGATPEELRPQFALLKEVMALHRIALFEEEGYEADDIIGTLSRKAEQEGFHSLIVTGDRDAWQLITADVEVLLTRKGISEIERYDEALLQEKVGLAPQQVIDFKGLMGDSSDNIPGVPGVGEKTALKLLKQFDSIEKLYEQIDAVKGKLQEKLRLHQEQALLSKELATIKQDMELPLQWSSCALQEPDYERLREKYEHLQFRTLLRNLPGVEKEGESASKQSHSSSAGNGENEAKKASLAKTSDYTLLASSDYGALLEILQEKGTKKEELVALWGTWEGIPRKGKLEKLVLAYGAIEAVPTVHIIDDPYAFFQATEPFWSSQEGQKVFFDAKAYWLLFQQAGIDLKGVRGDALLAAYLLDPVTNRYSLSELAEKYLGWNIDSTGKDEAPSDGEKASFGAALFALIPILEKALQEQALFTLYQEVELPLASILAAMEKEGFAVDPTVLQEMSEELRVHLEGLRQSIHDLADESFNINSTQQLGKILFEKLCLPVIKKTKTGYSTDVEVLEELRDRHPIVEKVIEYRQLMKLHSTYVEGLLPLIEADGCIHSTLNQTVTATGRLSSTDPNLQNIPIRLEEGRKIRKAFIAPAEETLLVAADYSQIELRILAHLSGDASLIDAFAKEQDIHTRTASEVFAVPMEEVTSEMRRRAKAVNFGIVYGISDFGLSRDLSVSRAEAKHYIEGYFARYGGVKDYIEKTIATARKDGYVTTLLGRRRHLPELAVRNKVRQAFGERMAMNTPIQGTASDIIKAAMVAIDRLLQEKQAATRMILQVHDELIFQVPRKELTEIAPMIQNVMETTIVLSVPLVVDMKIGQNWYDMTPYPLPEEA
ncbi:DNA polymerase I [Heliorestis convoluta]|uniref:DNA polymerase I n=1 Tax=Heliorestis convoluta TaxID=356322 RepID=A0A5Q2N142_9FIRM|nr:DNA polymerase I [Heliorestis convoluta]QGG49084.1 DNA polymerase I [Heliorestis convoluta]